MPRLKLSVPHQLSVEEALLRVKVLVDRGANEAQSLVAVNSRRWDGNQLAYQLSAMGFTVDGTMTVSEVAVVVDSSLPLAATMLRGRIERTITEELAKALA